MVFDEANLGAVTLDKAESQGRSGWNKASSNTQSLLRTLKKAFHYVTDVTLYYAAFLKLMEDRLPFLRVLSVGAALGESTGVEGGGVPTGRSGWTWFPTDCLVSPVPEPPLSGKGQPGALATWSGHAPGNT